MYCAWLDLNLSNSVLSGPWIVYIKLIIHFLKLYLDHSVIDASITWNVPSPQHSPVDASDVRRTIQRVIDGSAEVHLKWEYTLTGETLDRVLWEKDDVQIGRKSSSGVVIILSSDFEEHFNVSRTEQATLIIYNASQADGTVFRCTVETARMAWKDEIQVSVVCKYIQCM